MSAADVTPERVAELRNQYPAEMYSRNWSHQPVGSHAWAVLGLWDVLDALESAWAERDALRAELDAAHDGEEALRSEVGALRAQLAAQVVEVPELTDEPVVVEDFADIREAQCQNPPR